MATQAVGNLSVQMVANADPMVAEFRRAEAEVKSIGSRLVGSFAAVAKDFGGGVGDGLKGLLGGGLSRLGLGGGAAEIGKQVVDEVAAGIRQGLAAIERKGTNQIHFRFAVGDDRVAEQTLKEIGTRTAGLNLDKGAVTRGTQALVGTGLDPSRAVDVAVKAAKIGKANGTDPDQLIGLYARAVGRGGVGAREAVQGFADLGVPMKAIADANGMAVGELVEQLKNGRLPIEALDRTFNGLAERADRANAALDRTATGLDAIAGKNLDRIKEIGAGLPGLKWASDAASGAWARATGGWADALDDHRSLGWGRAWAVGASNYVTAGHGWLGPDRLAAPTADEVREHAAAARAAMRAAVEANAPTTLGELLKQRGGNPFRDAGLFPTMPDVTRLVGDTGAGRAFDMLLDAAGALQKHVGKFGDAVTGLAGAGADFKRKLEADALGPRTALDAYRQQNRRIDLAKLGGLSADAQKLARVDAFTALEKAVAPHVETRLAPALTAGSQEAESAISRAMQGVQSADDRVRQVMEAAVREQERTTRAIERLADALARRDAGPEFHFNP